MKTPLTHVYDSRKGTLALNLQEIFRVSQQQAASGKYSKWLEHYGFAEKHAPTTYQLFEINATDAVLRVAALTHLSTSEAIIQKHFEPLFLGYGAIGSLLTLTGNPLLGATFESATMLIGSRGLKIKENLWNMTNGLRKQIGNQKPPGFLLKLSN